MSWMLPFSWCLCALPSLLVSFMCMAKNWSLKDLTFQSTISDLFGVCGVFLVGFCFLLFVFHEYPVFDRKMTGKIGMFLVGKSYSTFKISEKKTMQPPPNDGLTGTFLPESLHLLAMKHKAWQTFLAIHPNPEENWWVLISLDSLVNTHNVSVFFEIETQYCFQEVESKHCLHTVLY